MTREKKILKKDIVPGDILVWNSSYGDIDTEYGLVLEITPKKTIRALVGNRISESLRFSGADYAFKIT